MRVPMEHMVTVQPFGNLATRRDPEGFGRAHGFASPPYDGFAVVEEEAVLSSVLPHGSGRVAVRDGHLSPSATKLGRRHSVVKPLSPTALLRRL